MTGTLWAITILSLFLLVLLGLYEQAPKCPHCGSVDYQQDEYLPHVRICASCGWLYDVH